MQVRHGRLHPRPRHAFTIEHDIGLEHAAAPRACRHGEAGEVHAVQVRVAIRRRPRRVPVPTGIAVHQLMLEVGARRQRAASQADDSVQAPVQVDHGVAAGLLVEAVDVLGDQRFDPSIGLDRGQRLVCRVRARGGEARPAGQAAGPVATADGGIAGERLERHRLDPLPAALGIAVVGNAGAGTDAGAGEYEQAAMPVDEVA